VSRFTDLRRVHAEEITTHYVTTLARWRERFVGAVERVAELGYDERFRRLWELYLSYCEGGFAEGRIRDFQLLLAKPGFRWSSGPGPALRLYVLPVQLAEIDALTSRDWDELVAGEPEPFGRVGEELTWRRKDRYVGVRDPAGRLLAAAGVALAEVRGPSAPAFPVAGLGGVIVTREARGRGLARTVIEGGLEIARRMPVEHAMLFCLPRTMGLYEKFDFRPLQAPVHAEQARGRVLVPMVAMWAPLREGASWPEGPIEVVGEPF
jgi:GNAT superfamily N-acetyltransferase